MLESIKRFLRDKKQLSEFGRVKGGAGDLVVFCDSPGMAVHLDPIMRCLVEDFGIQMSYFTTDPADPRIFQHTPGVHAYCLETPAVQSWFFKSLETHLFVTTTPDLGSTGFPRSVHPMQYVYIHHSMVSTHMIYQPEAFDHFDTIFCVGPHHEREIRAREKLFQLPAKNLIQHGSARLDEILEASQRCPAPTESSPVLVAPSWGPTGILEECGNELIRCFVEAGTDVLLRPHPETIRRTPNIVNDIVDAFKHHSNFHYEPDVASLDAMLRSRIMISDWSGAALEFAMGLQRPVIFVDVPRKVNNPKYQSLGLEPFEVDVRTDIGLVIEPARIKELPAIAADMDQEDWRQRCADVRRRHVYHPGNSTSTAAKWLAEEYLKSRDSRNS